MKLAPCFGADCQGIMQGEGEKALHPVVLAAASGAEHPGKNLSFPS